MITIACPVSNYNAVANFISDLYLNSRFFLLDREIFLVYIPFKTVVNIDINVRLLSQNYGDYFYIGTCGECWATKSGIFTREEELTNVLKDIYKRNG